MEEETTPIPLQQQQEHLQGDCQQQMHQELEEIFEWEWLEMQVVVVVVVVLWMM